MIWWYHIACLWLILKLNMSISQQTISLNISKQAECLQFILQFIFWLINLPIYFSIYVQLYVPYFKLVYTFTSTYTSLHLKIFCFMPLQTKIGYYTPALTFFKSISEPFGDPCGAASSKYWIVGNVTSYLHWTCSI